jgi:hypothetical protein
MYIYCHAKKMNNTVQYSIINDNGQIINAWNINTITTNLNRLASFLLERLTSDF